jgi:hypothetical protein
MSMSMSTQPWSTRAQQHEHTTMVNRAAQQSHDIWNKGSNLNYHSCLLLNFHLSMSNIILNCSVLSGEYTGKYKYWEWIKITDMATKAIQYGNLLINLIHMHTKAPIHHHDHKPTHGLPHTWQIKQYTCTDSHYIIIYNPQSIHGFTQNPQPIQKSTNPRPPWSWLHTNHLPTRVHPKKSTHTTMNTKPTAQPIQGMPHNHNTYIFSISNPQSQGCETSTPTAKHPPPTA